MKVTALLILLGFLSLLTAVSFWRVRADLRIGTDQERYPIQEDVQ